MRTFKKRSLTRYGVAMLVLAGSALLAGTSLSTAEHEPKPDHDCWLSTTRVCNLTYFPQCWQQPDGTSCFRCPYTMYGSANCVARPEFTCLPSDDLPFDCGPKYMGMCLDGVCFGEVSSPQMCTILQCVSISS